MEQPTPAGRSRSRQESTPALPPVATARLVDKLGSLTPEQQSEVEDFIDFLRQRLGERRRVEAAAAAAEPALARVWDNPDDAAYDEL